MELKRTIYKYPLSIVDMQVIYEIRLDRVLHVGLDPQGTPCVWCEVNNVERQSQLVIYIVGTGNEVPAGATDHIGSFVQGPFVWHVYI
jgi:hypothetical protein